MGNEAKSESVKEEQNVKRNTQREKRKFVCDRCGFEMFENNCKIICPNCGNRFDCSDLDVHFD